VLPAVALGGGGRYLVLRLSKAKKLAVFDVSAAQIVGHIPLREEGALFTAGLEDVIVVLPGSAVIESWSLKTFERDVAATLPIQGVIKGIVMGSASHGPLLIHWATGTEPLDRAIFTVLNTETMKVFLREMNMGQAAIQSSHYRDLVHLRASANGRFFGMWCTSHTPSGAASITITNTGATSHYVHSSEGHILPSPDGKTLFTGFGKRPLMVDLPQVASTGSAMFPACYGNYYLELPRTNKSGNLPPGVGRSDQQSKPLADVKHSAVIYSTENAKSTATVNDLQLPPLVGEDFIKHDFTFDKRIHLIPEARLIITIPGGNDRLILKRYGS
jgi:hypothetical protein